MRRYSISTAKHYSTSLHLNNYTIKNNSLLKLLQIHVHGRYLHCVFHEADFLLTEHVHGTIVGKRVQRGKQSLSSSLKVSSFRTIKNTADDF